MSLPQHDDLVAETRAILDRLGVQLPDAGDGGLAARSPITGGELVRVAAHTTADVAATVDAAHEAFRSWRTVPAPVRGALVRELGLLLREHKDDLGALVSIEAGKIRSEGLGEVQEMIDICDLAVGLSRQLTGLTIASERPGHRMMEQWHPLGVVGVISAFNFPVAVWSWNSALAFVCGDPVVWKPSEKTLLTALACQALAAEAARRVGAPGGHLVGRASAAPRSARRWSTTRGSRSSAPPGRPAWAARSRRGWPGASAGCCSSSAATTPRSSPRPPISTSPSAASCSPPPAPPGSAARRCAASSCTSRSPTSWSSRLTAAYASLPIGSPLESGTLVGPLVDEAAYRGYAEALEKAVANGGEVVAGGARVLADDAPDAYYVQPALVRMPTQSEIVQAETFAPILYVLTYSDFDEALAMHNDVPQGLSSSIFTLNVREAERFVSPDGSDCGIANVNIGPSGAEIGGAFGGEKETGGGRESGSDAWRAYMRRATNTVNYSTELPLAQGVEFG